MNTANPVFYRPSDDSSAESMGRKIINQIWNGLPARISREEIRQNGENSRHCFQQQLEQQQSPLVTSPQTQKVEGK